MDLFKKNYYLETYKKNKKGAFNILVALNKYEDIYSDWDPSPFRRRDIEEDFMEYIWDSAVDIPLHEDIRIVFLMDKKERDEKKEEHLLKALNNHFLYTKNKAEKVYLDEKKKSLRYLIIGLIFAVCAYSEIFSGVTIWTKIFEEGIVIGTWVFFWEAFYNIFIECETVRKELKQIKRFLKSEYVFRDNEM